jgi:hypothetical protein
MPGKGKSQEMKDIEEFQRKVEAGEITSYSQFPSNSWGFGMLIGLEYPEEIRIFEEMKAVGTAIGVNEDFAKQFLGKAKELFLAGREKEAYVYAYWTGKLVGRSERHRIKAMMESLGVGGEHHAG